MTPKRPLAYVRLSDLRADDLDLNGHAPSLDDQSRRIREWCAGRGWPAPEILVENDLTKEGKPKPASAFKRRKVRLPDGRHEYRVIRPIFRELVARLAAGRNDGLAALDLDRACRDPRDLEDLIDLVEQQHVTVDSVTGSLRLTTDADITMARVMVAMGNKASRDTARRVAAARERDARTGKYGGGRRPAGFDGDGVTRIEVECKAIRDAAYALLRGASLRGLARDWTAPTVTGSPMTAETLRDILLRPRNAGRVVLNGEVLAEARQGDDGTWWPWRPIVPGDVHDRVVAKLTDESRRTQVGRPPTWLGSGLYQCGVCDDGETTVEITVGGRAPRYRCRKRAHLARSQRHIDDWVTEVVMARLERDDARDLLVPPRPEVDAAALRVERAAIEDNLTAMAADAAVDTTGRLRRQLRAANERAAVRLAEIEAALSVADGPDPDLAKLVAAADPRPVWAALPLESRRLVVDKLMVVTILPTGRQGRVFDPASVRIEPRS
jgi:DNA invertase Pin-like site-specific DNA recombinase